MTTKAEVSEARERVIEVAERLFAQKGYAAVTLRDIANELGIKHASLYHHAPGGKEELYIEVMERTLKRHKVGMTQAITTAAPDIRSRLRAAADWLLSQPPMDLVRMVYSDMPEINADHARRLSENAFETMITPIGLALEMAQTRGEVKPHNTGVVAGGLLGMLESLHAVPQEALTQSHPSRERMAYELIDVMLNGIRTSASVS
jgi:AcrR family transcriptional regulator